MLSNISQDKVSMVTAQKFRKKRALPPGQRLLRYLQLAFVVTIIQGQFLPIGQMNEQFGKKAFAKESAICVAPPFNLAERQDDCESRLKQIIAPTRLRAGIFAVESKSGKYTDCNGKDQFAAASIIKLPVLVSLLAAIDRGEITKTKKLVITKDLIAGGSGHLQWRALGSKVTVAEAAELMIIVSDNTATNLLIDALGGKTKLNDEFASWGLTQTKISNYLGDFEGTNKTSPYDLVYLLARVSRGDIISDASRAWMFKVMERTRIATLLPPGLGPGAKIAHKTGDIASMVGDAGVVTAPSGERYFIAVQVERPRNDRRANLLIRSISKEIYQCFNEPPKN
jgi:beta-lactamase class A